MNNIVNSLRQIVDKSVDPELFPVQKGNKLFVGSHRIISYKDGYRVFDENKKIVAETRTKAGAVAVARARKMRHPEILRLDSLIDKNIRDCVFYKNHAQSDPNNDIADIRLQDSKLRIKDARNKLEGFIFA